MQIATLLSAAIAYYSEALSMGQRRDLTADYARMNTQIAFIAEDSINLLIEKGWMEEPPSVIDHESLERIRSMIIVLYEKERTLV
ncbi:DUF3231 family protein [Bacillus sp. AFS088145]|uniref:DUF3231 family protein n=1 Tax=Bacillus sp. AFS088145 TaxID=2033514 RepID=UPI00336AC568